MRINIEILGCEVYSRGKFNMSHGKVQEICFCKRIHLSSEICGVIPSSLHIFPGIIELKPEQYI